MLRNKKRVDWNLYFSEEGKYGREVTVHNYDRFVDTIKGIIERTDKR